MRDSGEEIETGGATISYLKQTLDQYPEIKKEFDLTAKKHKSFVDKDGNEIFRKWLGTIFKKIVPNKPKGLDDTDIKVLKWTLIRLRKKEFETEGDLFAAGNAIFLELYADELKLQEKKEKDKRGPTPIASLISEWRRE